METLSIEKSPPLPSIKDIMAIEKQFGISIPPQLQEIYLAYNPMYLKKRKVLANGIRYTLHGFDPIRREEKPNLASTYEHLGWFFEDKFLPFAWDEGGWLFVIGIQEGNYGKVYFCRMDKELKDATTLLADSLFEFLAKMVVED
jgi:hypothetical protein